MDQEAVIDPGDRVDSVDIRCQEDSPLRLACGDHLLGGKRAKAVLEVYVMTGLLSTNVSKVLQLFVSFDGQEPAGAGEVPMREILNSILQLDKVLGRQVDPTAVALSLLLDGDS